MSRAGRIEAEIGRDIFRTFGVILWPLIAGLIHAKIL